MARDDFLLKLRADMLRRKLASAAKACKAWCSRALPMVRARDGALLGRARGDGDSEVKSVASSSGKVLDRKCLPGEGASSLMGISSSLRNSVGIDSIDFARECVLRGFLDLDLPLSLPSASGSGSGFLAGFWELLDALLKRTSKLNDLNVSWVSSFSSSDSNSPKKFGVDTSWDLDLKCFTRLASGSVPGVFGDESKPSMSGTVSDTDLR